MDWSRSKRTNSFSAGSFTKPLHLNEHDRYPNSSTFHQHHHHQQQQQVIQPLQSQLPVRSAYYETHWPLFYSDWKTNNCNQDKELLAISSFREDSINRLEIVEGEASLVEHASGSTSDGFDFVKVAESNVELPMTKLQWDPSTNHHVNRLITSSDRLKVWEFDFANKLIERANLVNASHHNHSSTSSSSSSVSASAPASSASASAAAAVSRQQSLAPLTSFDWNKVSPNLVITSSIDTTCTLWDLNHVGSPKTQLIAHDSEVFDVQFTAGSTDIFISVGCDGSMRYFDLRSLQHSTIVYEPVSSTLNLQSGSSGLGASSGIGNKAGGVGIGGGVGGLGGVSGGGGGIGPQPLLRLATSNTDPNIVATFAAKSDTINILDLRYPGQPSYILAGHGGSVNSIKWHPSQPKLLSGGDDCQALIWDFSNFAVMSMNGGNKGCGGIVEMPSFAYNDALEINNVCWNAEGSWLGVTSGKGFQGVKFQ